MQKGILPYHARRYLYVCVCDVEHYCEYRFVRLKFIEHAVEYLWQVSHATLIFQ